MARSFKAALIASTLLALPGPAGAQTIEELKREIDELRTMVKALQAAQAAGTARPTDAAVATSSGATASGAPVPATSLAASPAVAPAAATPAGAPVVMAAAPVHKSKAWYERLQIRGYTQMRYNAFLSGDDTAPAGISRLRSVHDSSISDKGSFSLRRVRLVLQGDVTDRLSIYIQPDFATAVNNQAGSERREGFGQLRDAYADFFLDKDKRFHLRFGQSKVPYGWENLQSSSNRLTLDRSDAINSAVPGERDLGIVAYYTPTHVQKIWDRLAEDGQKLFGNYGAFGLALYNGQGINKTEQDRHLMKVAMATWPFELDGLGEMFEGQVLEVGASGMLNKVRPEVRSGGVSTLAYDDNRAGAHLILYPKPFGFQAEWNWGKGPQFDTATQTIRSKKLSGGYVQTMLRIKESPIGPIMPYARWQRYRGGWKASTNAPRLETDELELGVEWQIIKPLELTIAYASMKRSEADERRTGRAEGQLIRTQLQFSY